MNAIDVFAWAGFSLGIAMEIRSAVKGLQRNNWNDHTTQFYFAVGVVWLAGNVWIFWSCFHLLRFR